MQDDWGRDPTANSVPKAEEEKLFQMSDGSYIALSYGIPVHYLDEN